MKVKEITLGEAVKISAVDTNTGNVTYKDDVTGVTTTVPKGMVTPTAQGQVQISAQQVAPGQLGAAQAPTVKVGDQVKVVGQTGQTQTMGSMEENGDELSTYSDEDDLDETDNVEQVEQPYEDPQMEAIKRLAGL